jgi:hypothetical protein
LGFRKSENSIGFQEVRELYWVSGSQITLLGFRKSENSIGFQEVRELIEFSDFLKPNRVLLLPETQ